MSRASNRLHRALVFLAHVQQYRQYGPLVGPKEAHQPEHRWPRQSAEVRDTSGDPRGYGQHPIPTPESADGGDQP